MAVRRAPHDITTRQRPANQPTATVVLPKSIDTKAEYDAVLTAGSNRPPYNDLYERINFLETGRRTPRKPSSYGRSGGSSSSY